jgi:RNA polymerase sigma-70 factor, ECF subfamily
VPETGLSILGNLMNAKGRFDPEELLADARSGCAESFGKVLELNRTDLALLARAQVDFRLQGRLDASDLVQETFLNACRDFHHFRGTSHREWVAWLRKILFYNLVRVVQRQVAAKKRSTRREVSLDRRVSAMEQSSGTIQIETALVSRSSSPSSLAGRRERGACLANQLARLPADYREVLVLRNLEGLPFPEVARRMGRSAGAVRILWVRAVDQLRRLLQAEEML